MKSKITKLVIIILFILEEKLKEKSKKEFKNNFYHYSFNIRREDKRKIFKKVS